MSILKINLGNITQNYDKVKKESVENKCELITITKLFDSKSHIMEALISNGLDKAGDCFKENLSTLPNNVKTLLLLTRLSDVKSGLINCDSILTSDLKILEAISEIKNSKKIEIILSLELGDLRDGINPKDLVSFMRKASRIRNINLTGIGTNLGCLAGKLPDEKTFEILLDSFYNVKKEVGFEFQKISVGGTVFYDFIEQKRLPKEVNQLRIGEAIFFGYNMSYRKEIPSLSQNTFIFSAEIIEIYDKFVDFDDLGYNAFGERIKPEVTGLRKRAIADFGKLAASKKGLIPFDKNIFIDAQTHNHSVIDITESKREFKVGDFIDFKINYNSAATIFACRSIKKQTIF